MRGYSLPLPAHTSQDLQLELQGHSGARIVESAMDQSIGFGGWPQPCCRERARAGDESRSWGPRFRGVPFTSTCRILDIASPTGKSKDPRATTFRDTAAAAMGTTEKPTGRAEPAGTCTCWASPPPPARHSPSTGDTWTLTWGQEDGEGQSPSPVRLPTLTCPSPATTVRTAAKGPHSQIAIQVVVEDRPQLELLKAADRDRQAEVHVEFTEHSESGRGGHTQA